MSTTVLLGLTSFEKNWGPVDFWGGQWLQELNVEGWGITFLSYCIIIFICLSTCESREKNKINLHLN